MNTTNATVCLIRPGRIVNKGAFSVGVAIPPIGLAYLASSLEKEKFEVTPIDAIGEKIDQLNSLPEHEGTYVQGLTTLEILQKISNETLFIGVSCMFSCEWFYYEILITEIKKKFPHIPIVVGGEHVTAEAENVLKVCPAVDVCAIGEGEATIIELARAYVTKKELTNIDGICYRENGKIKRNKKRERIKHVDTIPNPSWEKFPIQNYLERGYAMASIKRRALPILASRGCPYRCTFCSSPQMWGTDLNLRDPALVVDEIVYYKEKYNIEHIDFVDIVGMMNRDWVRKLLNLMIEKNLGITWMLAAGTRSEILDQEILELFKKSNVLRVFFAPESGSAETLKRIKKRVNLDKMMKSMKMAHALGISMRAPVIYGFPGQSLKEAFQNLFFSFKLSYLGVDDVVAHVFGAYPGSELFNELKASGDIDIDKLIAHSEYNNFLRSEIISRISNFKSWSKSIPSWSLVYFQYGGMAVSYGILFLFHPSKLFKLIYRVVFLKKPLTLLEIMIFGLFNKPRQEIKLVS